MSKYNPETTRILFENSFGGVSICTPSGILPCEVVAVRDLPAGTPYWIIDYKTTSALNAAMPDGDFYDAYELDHNELGAPHGVALGYEEWAKLQPPGTPGV